MVQQQIQEALVDLAAEEAQEGAGTLKELRDVTKELENLIPSGEGQMKMMSSADRLQVWNQHSGRMSWILTDQLRFQLKKRFPANHPLAGERVYGLRPIEMPKGQGLTCLLHPENELRAWLDEIGLQGKTCSKKDIPTEYAVGEHMRKKHPRANDLIWDERAKKTRREEQEMRQKQLEALQTMADRQAPAEQPINAKPAEARNGLCDICGKAGLKNVGAHKRGAHKDQ